MVLSLVYKAGPMTQSFRQDLCCYTGNMYRLLCLGILIVLRLGLACEGPCSCTHGLRSVILNCTALGLNEPPESYPENVTEIHLANNNLTSLSPLPSCKEVRYLDLSNNKLVYIAPNTFQAMPKLEVLLLRQNLLNFTLLHTVNAFFGLQNLNTLDISGNYLFLQMKEYPDKLLYGLSSLRHLYIDGISNPAADFGPGFSNLTSLESLRIHSMITHVSNTTFEAFRNTPLKNLTIWSGWLSTVESYAFAPLSHLELLDLSFNPQLGFKNVTVAWPGLAYTNITTLILAWATPFETGIVTLEPWFFYGLENTRIQKLVLDGNHIVTAHGLFSRYLPNLVEFSISRNRLVQVNNFMEDLAKLPHLKKLDARYQAKRLFITEEEILAGLPLADLLAGLAGRNPVIPNLGNPVLGDTLLVEEGALFPSSVPENVSDTAPKPFRASPYYEIDLPETLEDLLLTGSLTLDVDYLPKTILRNGINLKRVEYADNGLERVEGALIFMNASVNPITIDLSDNDCMHISGIVSDETTALSIEHLLISKNKLNDYLNDPDLGFQTLSAFQNLRTLDLRENVIKFLPERLFEQLTKLENIQLGNNALRTFNLDLHAHHNLNTLDLSNNLINSLNSDTSRTISDIAKYNAASNRTDGYSFHLNLVGNPLICSCDTLDFLKWIQTERSKEQSSMVIEYMEFDQYSCVLYSGEESWDNDQLREIITKLDWDCSKNLVIILTTVLSAVVIIAIVVAVYLHHHMWEIRFWCIHMVIKKKEKRSCEEGRPFKYDVFVAFHQDSLTWIKHQMLPVLEGDEQHPLKLCLHQRDFTVGLPIEENIVQSIKESRKTILVISKQFVKSSWCYFEMQMARAQGFDEGRNLIIAIVLDEITSSTEGVSQTLMNILRSQTHIVWPSDPNLHEEFWRRMRDAISSSKPQPIKCDCGRALAYNGAVYREDGTQIKVSPGESGGQDNVAVDMV